EDLLSSRKDRLRARELEARLALVLDELVGHVEIWRIAGDGERRSDAEARDRRALGHEPCDGSLIESSRREDLHTLEPGAIESPASLTRELAQVARIEPNRANAELFPEAPRELDHPFDAGDRVVRVDEKDGLGKNASEGREGVKLALVRLDIAVSHRARD